ncbi:MAG: hypothetical protein CVT65_18235 [Actinobacteria bacterium HGW-Actinobacteria-5]|nr:MAG: hypothetical protein CVT65_18235 [Actinobacteria bacterium HGW-Actinobacteria-5]
MTVTVPAGWQCETDVWWDEDVFNADIATACAVRPGTDWFTRSVLVLGSLDAGCPPETLAHILLRGAAADHGVFLENPLPTHESTFALPGADSAYRLTATLSSMAPDAPAARFVVIVLATTIDHSPFFWVDGKPATTRLTALTVQCPANDADALAEADQILASLQVAS